MRLTIRSCVCWLCASILAVACVGGCNALPKSDSGVRFVKDVDPETGEKYYLAVPSKHTSEKRWTLVVTCHGTPPWDTAIQQIGRWGSLAESRQVVVAAPILKGTTSDRLFPIVRHQIANQQRDERVVLSLVERLRSSYNIDSSRVFLTGWSGGSYAVLYIGLRNPDVFRALAVHQGNFDERFVQPAIPRLDPYQPVQLSYGLTDLLKSQAEDALAWLHGHRMVYAVKEELSGHHRLLPEVAYKFFRRCVREHPWIVVKAEAGRPEDLMAIKFRVRSYPKAESCLWKFGDGSIAPTQSPEHIYSKEGTYTVQVTIKTEDDQQFVRTIRVTVPVARIGVAAGGA